MFKNGMPPIHPGEILLEDYLKPLGMSENALAKALGVPASRINAIIKGARGITADTALRLERFFGAEATGWLNLQATHDLRVAEIEFGKRITAEISPHELAKRNEKFGLPA